jgi:hypothetical protein
MLHQYDHERMAQTHRQELLREAEHERLLKQLPRPRLGILNILRLPLQIKLSRLTLHMRQRQGF